MHRHDRSKSAGHSPTHSPTRTPAHNTTQSVRKEDIRGMCKKIAPYLSHQWRDVCEDLGVTSNVLDQLKADSYGAKLSEVAFRGLSQWFEKEGGANRTEQLMNVLQENNLRRAQEELRNISQKNVIPIARPVASLKHALRLKKQDYHLSRHARQQVAADRLSRPKSSFAKKEKTIEELQLKSASQRGSAVIFEPTGHELCEVKLRITVRHVQRDFERLKQAEDDSNKVKDDYKHLCHTFVKFVHENANEHLRLLKKVLIEFDGISVRKLTKVGFNIYCVLLCSNLGAFETFHQAYKSGRLTKLCHDALVNEIYLRKLHATEIELSAHIDEGVINNYRDILLVRSGPEVIEDHPVDDMDLPIKYTVYNLMRHDYGDAQDPELFDFDSWQEKLYKDIEALRERHAQLDEEAPELLITLRILRPLTTEQVTSLQEVIDYFRNLRPSSSLSRGIRTDLLREYIAIVNNVRLKVEEIHKKDIHISFDETLHPDACETFHELLTEIDAMLEPTFRFKDDDSKITLSLNVVERETFGKLLSYIPSLLDKLAEISDVLTRKQSDDVVGQTDIDQEGDKIDAVSLDNGTSSEDISVVGSSNSDSVSLVHVTYTEDGDIENVAAKDQANDLAEGTMGLTVA